MSTDDPKLKYHGRILNGDFSREIKDYLKKTLPVFHAFDEAGSPAILYIAAWQGNEKNIWYEFAGQRFLRLIGCEHSDIAETLRKSIVDRRIYRPHGIDPIIQEEVLNSIELNKTREKIREDTERKGIIEAVYKLLLPSGKTVWAKDQAAIISYPEDHTSLSLGCLTIVTKEMEAEEEKQRLTIEKNRLEKQLQQVHQLEAIGNLAEGIAHDLTHRIVGIQKNVTELMDRLGKKKYDETTPFQHYQSLKNIEQHLTEVNNLSAQLLTFAGKGAYNYYETDLNELVGYTVKEFFAARPDVKVNTFYQDNLWRVNIDRVMIGRALQRLYQDACRRATKDSDVRIQTANVLLDDNFVQPFGRRPGAYTKVSVQIQEIISDENNKQRTFEPFYTDKENAEAGLGMASVFGIVKKHDGLITVSSDDERSSFNIFLPSVTSGN
jgi:signal transduction histidine kinase